MLSLEKKRALKKLLISIDPKSSYTEALEEIEEAKEQVKNIVSSWNPQTKESITSELIAIIDGLRSSIEERFEELKTRHINEVIEMKFGLDKSIKDSLNSFYSRIDEIDKKSSKIFGDDLPAIKKEVSGHKDRTSQIVEELRGELKVIYSKMGGGTMPLIPQIEIPSGTNDGVNAVFTARYKPLFTDVSGQMMVSNIDDANNFGYTLTGSGPWTITFVNPPASGQVPHSYHV